MSVEEGVNREQRIGELQRELAELTGETVGEVEEVIENAEEEVIDSAEDVQEPAAEAHETVTEAAHEIEETVEEEAHEAAAELGHPEMAAQIAEHLFDRLDREGLLAHTHHEATPEIESLPAEAVAPVEHVEHVPDVAPEPQHFWYRPISLRRR